MTTEELILIGVFVNSFLIQGPWFILWLMDRRKNKTNELLDTIRKNTYHTSCNTFKK